MSSLKHKTLFITGASRGIGKAIALRAARDGANIVVAAKTADRDRRAEPCGTRRCRACAGPRSWPTPRITS
jgi:NAD(P)-dependent dehydrogenase (short-subunit alcohol dehydrogenase family)